MKSLKKKNSLISDILGKHKHVVKHDIFDEREFKKSVGKALFKLQEEGKKDYEQFSELLQDVFSSLYKSEPKTYDDLEINKDFLLNKLLIEELTESQKYKELRVDTIQDEIISTIGTETLGTELKEHIKALKEKAKEALEELEEALSKLGDGEENQEGELPGPDAIDLEEAKKALEEAKKEIKEEIKSKDFAPHLKRALDLAHSKVVEAQDVLQAWGLGASNTYSQSSYREKLDLLNKLKNNPKFKRIAELAGRFIKIALSAQREKIKEGVREISSVEYSKNIEKILPAELINLTDERLEYNFYTKYTEGQLQTYKFKGKAKKKRGPIVICLDSSGSMSGDADCWAKAVGIALLEVAREQKRNFAGIHFSGDYNPANLKVHQFLKTDEHDINKILDFCMYFEGGGTNFESPLTRARQFCESGSEDWERSSIIFVTDGQAPVTESFLKEFKSWKQLRKVNVISVQIDCGYNFGRTLEEFSDEIHKLSSLNNHSEAIAINIFENMQ